MNRIKDIRKFFSYTQDTLAKMLHVSRSTVAMWETSSQSPDYVTLRNISQMFNLPPDFIMGDGIFSKWDLIKEYYDDVSRELINLIPNTLEMPSFCEDKYLVAWLDTRLYSEPDEMQLVRWFDFAVLDIDINVSDDDFCPDVQVDIIFTPEFLALINAELRKESSGSQGVTHSVTIPVLGDVAAGLPIEAVENLVDYEEIDQAMAASGEHFGLRLKGDSMEPRMKDGDVVIVRKQEDVESGDTAVVLVNGNSATVKRIKKGPSGISLIPNNPAYDPMFYTCDEIAQLPVRILGKVVELRGKF